MPIKLAKQEILSKQERNCALEKKMETLEVTTEVTTEFAPAQREDRERLVQQSHDISSISWLKTGLDAIPLIVFVLNSCRQIIFVNKTAQVTLGIENVDALYGFRPGEALNCTHSSESPGGCGTSVACRSCGAVLTILDGLNGIKTTRECGLINKGNNATYNLRVTASPINLDGNLDGNTYVIVSAVDISNEKWRRMIERTFFHDVLNLIGGVKGVSELVADIAPRWLPKIKRLSKNMAEGVNDIIDEIYSQKDVLSAESNEIVVSSAKIESLNFLQKLTAIYQHHRLTVGKTIRIDSCVSRPFQSDPRLLRRIIGNMIKNAVEASQEHQEVIVGCEVKDDRLRFYVHNATFIPEDLQQQIFQRSFSTKGNDRGIGTYSIKLLGEKYLNGKVWFTSTMQEGTTFNISLPL
jgi:nitrogen fixation/metabolism regulation signal transduction histidine kinase